MSIARFSNDGLRAAVASDQLEGLNGVSCVRNSINIVRPNVGWFHAHSCVNLFKPRANVLAALLLLEVAEVKQRPALTEGWFGIDKEVLIKVLERHVGHVEFHPI